MIFKRRNINWIIIVLIQATTAAAGADVDGVADGAVAGVVAITDAEAMEAITADGIIENAKTSLVNNFKQKQFH